MPKERDEKLENEVEEKPGLLHHTHDVEAENPYNPDASADELDPSPQLVERAASESHHGVIRDRDPVKLGREEEAKLALENTEISTATAWIMTVLFLITICVPAILQSTFEMRRNAQANKVAATNGEPAQPIWPQIFDVMSELPTLEKIKNVRSFEDVASLVPDADRIKSHETTLEDEALLVKWMLPRAQYTLTKWGGVGNEQAYVGREKWLFYRPDVDYLTSPGFLDPALQTVRARAGDASTEAVQPDPVKAILRFRDHLQTRGIKLVIVPMTVKPMLYGEKLSVRGQPNFGALQNPSYNQFIKRLEAREVLVFDPTDTLQRMKKLTSGEAFLETDTHWKPEAMEAVARDLALYIRDRITFDGVQQEYSRRAKSIENLGDTATMLNLSDKQDLFPKQRVQIKQVFDEAGNAWRRDKNAEVLLLGDSFCNIYSLTGMGWGSGAGFAEQLSFYLKRPLDSIVVNAGGSHTSRQRLLGEMRRAARKGENRLETTRLVVWEFSMRDLLIGDWKLLDLPS